MKITKSQLKQLISEELDGVTEKVVKRDGEFYVDPKKKGAKTMGPYSKDKAERVNQARNIGANMGEALNEDGHIDVPSARRKLKTAMEDAAQILQGLEELTDENDLPAWWMSKVTLASDYLNKARDYFLVSGD